MLDGLKNLLGFKHGEQGQHVKLFDKTNRRDFEHDEIRHQEQKKRSNARKFNHTFAFLHELWFNTEESGADDENVEAETAVHHETEQEKWYMVYLNKILDALKHLKQKIMDWIYEEQDQPEADDAVFVAEDFADGEETLLAYEDKLKGVRQRAKEHTQVLPAFSFQKRPGNRKTEALQNEDMLILGSLEQEREQLTLTAPQGVNPTLVKSFKVSQQNPGEDTFVEKVLKRGEDSQYNVSQLLQDARMRIEESEGRVLVQAQGFEPQKQTQQEQKRSTVTFGRIERPQTKLDEDKFKIPEDEVQEFLMEVKHKDITQRIHTAPKNEDEHMLSQIWLRTADRLEANARPQLMHENQVLPQTEDEKARSEQIIAEVRRRAQLRLLQKQKQKQENLMREKMDA